MTQHRDLTLPEDIHYTKLASTAGAGTVLRYTGDMVTSGVAAQEVIRTVHNMHGGDVGTDL